MAIGVGDEKRIEIVITTLHIDTDKMKKHMEGHIKMKIGDRVIIKNTGDLGHIESIDMVDEFGYCNIRLLTPNNEPSVLVTTCSVSSIIKVSEKVVPVPKNEAWWEEAREFCNSIEVALLEMFKKENL